MAVKVPTYQPDVSLRPINQQDLEIRAKPEAFGWDVGQGVAGLGKGMQQASNALVELKDLEATTEAKTGQNAFMEWTRNRQWGPGGYMTLQGDAAIKGRATYEQEVEAKRKEIMGGLTPVGQRKFNDASLAHTNTMFNQAIVHEGAERKKYINDTSVATQNNFINQALVNFNDPAQVNKYIAAGQIEIRQNAQLNGEPPEVTKLKEEAYVSNGFKGVTQRLLESNPLAAQKFYETNKARINGPDQFELEHKLKDGVLDAKAAQRETEFFGNVTRDTGTPAPATPPTPAPGQPATVPGAPQVAPKPAKTVADTGPSNVRAFLSTKLTKGKDRQHVEGLDVAFATNLAALMQDAPPEIRDGLGIYSGYRSVERQKQLWDASDKTGKWVAPPGRSFHNHGEAVDLAWQGQSLKHAPKNVQDWVHQNAQKYNLYFPMAHEPWHIEPIGTRSGQPRPATAVAPNTPTSATVTPGNTTLSPRATMPSMQQLSTYLDSIADPAERDRAQKRILSRYSLVDKQREAQVNEAKLTLQSHVMAGNTPDTLPLDIRTLAGMPAVEAAWNFHQKEKGGRVVTDEVLFSQMQELAARDPKAFAAVDLSPYMDKLSKDDWRKANDLKNSALTDERKAREEGLNLTAAYNQAATQLEAVGITTKGKKDKAYQDAQLRIAQFNNALSNEMETFKKNKGVAPNQMEIQQMINRQLLPIAVKRPGMLWDSVDEKRLFEAGTRPDNSTVDVVVKYEDIPIDLRRGISTDLERELGRKPTKEEVADRYEKVVLDR